MPYDGPRKRPRQGFLNAHERRELARLKEELRDHNEHYAGVELSEREMRDLEHMQRVVKLLEEKEALGESAEGFHFQDDASSKVQLLKQKHTDQFDVLSKWRNDMEQTAIISRKSEKSAKNEKEYDLVFDEDPDESDSDDDLEMINFQEEDTLDSLEPKSKYSASANELIDAVERRVATIDEIRKSLPMFAYREELLSAVSKNQVLIVVGETGSGKTTQLPQYLDEAGYTAGGKVVGCTQPRRVAATSVATRVAEEAGTRVGEGVGFSIRFQDCTSSRTRIKYMTDGMLLREFLTSPDLAQYSALMIDEAHERSLSTDILLGLLKDVTRKRPDLRLVVASATMNASKFSAFFNGAPIFNVPGRMHTVDILYAPQPEADYVMAAVVTVFQIHMTQPPGDILVFLTGQGEIETAQERVEMIFAEQKKRKNIAELMVCPIYANMPPEMQGQIFTKTPPGRRKVVLATNIAETSITIDGVVYVVDSGLVKQNSYSPKSGLQSLVVTTCSQAAANQRAGRAGRVRPGKCFRLYTKETFEAELERETVPEIQRTNLANVVLLLASLGIQDLVNFDFIDPPPHTSLIKALETLYAAGAFRSSGSLTEIGRMMAEFPIDPLLSRSIIAAGKQSCVEACVTVVAMLAEASTLFVRPKNKTKEADDARKKFLPDGEEEGGDFRVLYNVWTEWERQDFSAAWASAHFVQYKALSRVRNVRRQLLSLCKRMDITDEGEVDETDFEPVQRALCAGLFFNTAVQGRSEAYRMYKSSLPVYIHPSCSLFKREPPVRNILWYELVLTSKEYARHVMSVKPKWLLEAAPHYFTLNDFKQ